MLNRCENDDCKRPFAPDQVVYVTKITDVPLLHCCSSECRTAVEAKLAQGDMFPNHQLAMFKINRVIIPDAFLRALPNTIKDGDVHTELKIAIPFGVVPTDEILSFRDRCTVTLSTEDIVGYESETIPGEDKDELANNLAATLALKEGAASRWAERSANPMTDKELKLAIAEEFGITGDTTLNDTVKVHFEGGEEPKIWIGIETNEPPTLGGRKLVKLVRQIYGIPKPEKGQ